MFAEITLNVIKRNKIYIYTYIYMLQLMCTLAMKVPNIFIDTLAGYNCNY